MVQDISPLVPLVQELHSLASEELPAPTSMRLITWDDGDFSLTIWHSHGLSDGETGVSSESISYAVDRGEFVKVTTYVDDDGENSTIESLGKPNATVEGLPVLDERG